jgi:hypothetical protein
MVSFLFALAQIEVGLMVPGLARAAVQARRVQIKNALHCKNLTRLNNAKATHLCCDIVNEFGV